MKRYGKLFDSGHWLDAQWWYPEADFLQLGESYDAQGIAYNALAAELATEKQLRSIERESMDTFIRQIRALQARVAALEAAKGLLEDAVRQIVETSQEHPAKANYVAVHRQIIGYARTLIQPSSTETPGDAWLCVCGLTVKKRYQCLCGGREDNSRADRFTSDRAGEHT